MWNRGVLDATRKTVCFRDSPFTRRKLENAQYLCADGQAYRITELDDHDAGWLMVTGYKRRHDFVGSGVDDPMKELHVKSLLPVRLDKYLMDQYPAWAWAG